MADTEYTYRAETHKMKTMEDNLSSTCTDVIVPKETTVITTRSFSSWVNLSKVEFEDIEGSQLYEIKHNAFKNCKSLRQITIPPGVKTIGEEAFAYCHLLETVDFYKDSRLQFLGRAAFSECRGITEIALPLQLRIISERAFSSCTGLTEIAIPHSVNEIGAGAFENCEALRTVKFMHMGFEEGETCRFYKDAFPEDDGVKLNRIEINSAALFSEVSPWPKHPNGDSYFQIVGTECYQSFAEMIADMIDPQNPDCTVVIHTMGDTSHSRQDIEQKIKQDILTRVKGDADNVSIDVLQHQTTASQNEAIYQTTPSMQIHAGPEIQTLLLVMTRTNRGVSSQLPSLPPDLWDIIIHNYMNGRLLHDTE